MLTGDPGSRDRQGAADRVTRLAAVVEREAWHAHGPPPEGDPKLRAAGWERRFVTDRRRLEEVSALYEQLGYEVLAVPVRAGEVARDCEDCQLIVRGQFITVYTRKRSCSPP